MKVKLKWLNELVSISDLTTTDIVRALSLYSTEVEGAYKLLSGSNLITGYVNSAYKMDGSDHLSICKVDIGNEILQIICGAPNIRTGQYVIVAKPGAVLAGGVKIKKTKIRGVESFGMICSLEELGMEKKYVPEEYQNGIFYFKNEAEVGADPLSALDFDDDIIELGLTPNRGDLLSMLGVAIEVGAVFKRPYHIPEYHIHYSDEQCQNFIKVSSSSEDCAGYYAQIIKNVSIGPSPWWLVARLISFGIRPINNVVDITNYILALFGQPLHAFDYEKLGKNILVRKAKAGERIITLDGEERLLIEEDLIITDGISPVAIAGVMGGAESGINESTKTIVLEAAVFDPVSVYRTAKRLNLRSDASLRFEKGVDINRTKIALDYASYLMQNICEAEVPNSPAFVGNASKAPVKLNIRSSQVNRLLGTSITDNDIIHICHRLDFQVKGNISVFVPNRRPDIRIKEDLIEEIARFYGYDRLPATLPASPGIGRLSYKQIMRRKIKDLLSDMGFNQLITYALNSWENSSMFTGILPKGSEAIEILNPIVAARGYLRTSLIPGLINNAIYCYSHKLQNLSTFELGKIFYRHHGDLGEREHLCIFMMNNFGDSLFKNGKENADFYLLKGLCDKLFHRLGIRVTYSSGAVSGHFHPKRSAWLYTDNELTGFIGALHPQFITANDLDECYVMELDLTNVLNAEKGPARFRPFSKLPAIERDIAVIIKRDIPAGALISAVGQSGFKHLHKVEIFDVYTGPHVNHDEKSVAIKLSFIPDRAVTDEDINKVTEKIINKLSGTFGAKLRH